MIRVENISALPIPSASVEQQRPMLQQEARQRAQQSQTGQIDALKKTATIKDNRVKFY